MLGGKGAAAEFGAKLLAGIERHAERGRVRLQQHVGHDDLVLEVGPRALVARILVRADVIPGPAVETALAHPGDVIGRQVVAETVALVGRAPQIAGGRVHGDADAVADAGREHLLVFSLRIEHEDAGAVGLVAPGGAGRMLLLPLVARRRVKPAHPLCDIGL